MIITRHSHKSGNPEGGH